MGWVALGSAIVIVAAVVWSLVDGETRWWWIVPAALVCLSTAFFWWRTESLERDLASIVRELSGVEDASVSCKGLWGEMFGYQGANGWVYFDEPVVHLRNHICSDLRSVFDLNGEPPTREQIYAVHILTHEAFHVAGHRNEGVTNCYAVQHNAETAMLMGMSASEANALSQQYYDESFSRIRGEYMAPLDCFEDGPMDLTPGDGSFL